MDPAQSLVNILKTITPEIKKAAPDVMHIIVSNPVGGLVRSNLEM